MNTKTTYDAIDGFSYKNLVVMFNFQIYFIPGTGIQLELAKIFWSHYFLNGGTKKTQDNNYFLQSDKLIFFSFFFEFVPSFQLLQCINN